MRTSERFMSKVHKTESCWNWTASKMNSGYGQFFHNNTMRQAHRVAYEMFKGPIPNGEFVLHECDNRLCVNPAHLQSGTHSQNMIDAYARGRKVRPNHRGENHPGAKVDLNDVCVIRIMRNEGMTQQAIAAAFEIKRSLVSDIVNGRCWK